MIKFNQFIVLSFDLRRNAHISTMHERWWWQNNRNLRWKWKQNSNKENNTKRSSNGISAHQFQRCVFVCVCVVFELRERARRNDEHNMVRNRRRSMCVPNLFNYISSPFTHAHTAPIRACVLRKRERNQIVLNIELHYIFVRRNWSVDAHDGTLFAWNGSCKLHKLWWWIKWDFAKCIISPSLPLRSSSITSRTRSVCDDEWAELLVAQITREVVKP